MSGEGMIPSDSAWQPGDRTIADCVAKFPGASEASIRAAFEKRLLIYRTKHGEADPFAGDLYNRWSATKYVIEAIELLAIEAGFGDLAADSDFAAP